jgi:hypothetical protein
VKPFYRYIGMKDRCQCGSGRRYRVCCFHDELIGFCVGALVLAALFVLPSEGWPFRIICGGIGLLFWLYVITSIWEWFTRR